MTVEELIAALRLHSPKAPVRMTECEQDDGFNIGKIVSDEKAVMLVSGNAAGYHLR